LLIGAGLLTRSLVALTQTALGFTMDRILTFQVNVGPSDKYSSSALEDQFFDAVETSLRALPGVRGIATAGYPPLGGGASSSLAIEGRNIPEGQTPEVGYIPVSDDYFKLLQIPLRAGRAFDARDIKAAPPVVVLSEGLVKQQWPDGGALGARVRLGPNPRDPWATVVGIAGDIRQSPQVGPRPMAYVSRRQDHWGSGVVFIAAKGDPRAMLPVVQRAVQEIDPDMPLIGVRTMDEYFTQSLGTQRLPMIMLSAFALLAVVLAAVGIYGVTAYAVTARTRELGIRVALGAQRQAVLRLVIGGGMRLLLAGVVIGLAAAAALTRLLAALLVGVEPLDLPTFGAAAVTLSAVTLVACWLPARRATRVDPIVALRSE
jgi:putative ABC transport system permease protein